MSKSTPTWLLALGKKGLPPQVSADGCVYRWSRTFKHDFFAATALYERESGRVLVKINRQAPMFGLPMRWIGRILANRECAALTRLAGIHGVPRLIARFERTGFVREFVEGEPMAKGRRVPDDFHAKLRALVAEIHRRDMAYVDLEKCENVLVGADGHPYLFDFQIAWYVAPRWGGNLWPLTALRRFFQNGDLYHLKKLQRRTRPDQFSAEELAATYARPWYVRLHFFLVRPFTLLRRWVLGIIDPRRKRGERGRIDDPVSLGDG